VPALVAAMSKFEETQKNPGGYTLGLFPSYFGSPGQEGQEKGVPWTEDPRCFSYSCDE
jgi:hypothetical protein